MKTSEKKILSGHRFFFSVIISSYILIIWDGKKSLRGRGTDLHKRHQDAFCATTCGRQIKLCMNAPSAVKVYAYIVTINTKRLTATTLFFCAPTNVLISFASLCDYGTRFYESNKNFAGERSWNNIPQDAPPAGILDTIAMAVSSKSNHVCIYSGICIVMVDVKH